MFHWIPNPIEHQRKYMNRMSTSREQNAWKNALNLIFKPHFFFILSNVKRCGRVNLGSIIHFRTAKTIELWPRILKFQTLALLKTNICYTKLNIISKPHIFLLFSFFFHFEQSLWWWLCQVDSIIHFWTLEVIEQYPRIQNFLKTKSLL
jgi:hypothetical protein